MGTIRNLRKCQYTKKSEELITNEKQVEALSKPLRISSKLIDQGLLPFPLGFQNPIIWTTISYPPGYRGQF